MSQHPTDRPAQDDPRWTELDRLTAERNILRSRLKEISGTVEPLIVSLVRSGATWADLRGRPYSSRAIKLLMDRHNLRSVRSPHPPKGMTPTD